MPYFYYFICLTLLCSCHGKSSQNQVETEVKTIMPISSRGDEVKYVNSVKLTSPGKNELYAFGEEITVAFDTKERFSIDSSSIFINGKEVARLGKGENRYALRLPDNKAGRTVIKVTTWHPERKIGSASVNIQLKPAEAPKKYDYEIVNVYPHDPEAYTQGLQYWDGYLYEGTGQYGESSIRKVETQNGHILAVLNMDNQYFGEGVTIYRDKIYQITWRSRKGFIYDLKTFSLESTFSYHSEGWGITTADDHLIMSDGSNKLYHVSPSGFSIFKEVEVYDHNGPVDQLNELEYIDGLVWANIWLTDRIVAIDPETGAVKAELDMTKLLSATEKARLNDSDDVLNGIAWNPKKNTFYLTGKRWPKLFEIRLKP